MVLNDTIKIEEDGIIMEFDTNDEHEAEIMQVALYMFINASNEKLPNDTRINVERDDSSNKVRVISDKGDNAVRNLVMECIEILASIQDDGTF